MYRLSLIITALLLSWKKEKAVAFDVRYVHRRKQVIVPTRGK